MCKTNTKDNIEKLNSMKISTRNTCIICTPIFLEYYNTSKQTNDLPKINLLKILLEYKIYSCVNRVHQSYFVTSKNIMHIPRLNTNTYDTQISLVKFLIIKIEIIQILNSKPNPLESNDHTMNIQISLCLNL